MSPWNQHRARRQTCRSSSAGESLGQYLMAGGGDSTAPPSVGAGSSFLALKKLCTHHVLLISYPCVLCPGQQSVLKTQQVSPIARAVDTTGYFGFCAVECVRQGRCTHARHLQYAARGTRRDFTLNTFWDFFKTCSEPKPVACLPFSASL